MTPCDTLHAMFQTASNKRHSLKIFHRFGFTSARKRMATLVTIESAGASHIYALAKGAPEVTEPCVRDPFSFLIHFFYRSEGSRPSTGAPIPAR